jgi:drug/metabolite transporter (DMT)-like permease
LSLRCSTWPGLGRAGPTTTSLVLNFEAVFTALFAWLLYREPIGSRVLAAVLLMLAGGMLMVEGGVGGAAPLIGVIAAFAAAPFGP